MTDKNVGSNEFTTVTEGSATILFPKGQVFYNPVQQFNRDLSVAVIRTWSESPITEKQLRKAAWEQKRAQATSGGMEDTEEQTNGSDVPQRRITVLEALSATGLRAIRYALEIPAIQTLLANDMSPSAIEAIHRNIAHNNIPPNLIRATCSDANALMYSHRTERIDVIDLDPYGTATPFIDSAIQAISSDGLLCVTCTDMSVTAGQGYPEKCFASYGGLPVKQEYTHEVVPPIFDERLILGVEIGAELDCYDCGKVRARCRAVIVSFCRLLCQTISTNSAVSFKSQVSCEVCPLNVEIDNSKTMITYNCTQCGSWANQHLGRTTTKGENTKFQLNYGPPTDINCCHCGGRQMVPFL